MSIAMRRRKILNGYKHVVTLFSPLFFLLDRRKSETKRTAAVPGAPAPASPLAPTPLPTLPPASEFRTSLILPRCLSLRQSACMSNMNTETFDSPSFAIKFIASFHYSS